MSIPSAWSVSEAGHPVAGSAARTLRFALTYARLAPSSHNSQPWLFRIHEASVQVIADRSRALPVVDPEHRALVMSCGAALFHLRLALRRLGRTAPVKRLPNVNDVDLLAQVRLGELMEPTDADARLFAAIAKRRTNRGPFEPKAPPRETLEGLKHAAADQGATLHLVEPDKREALADLIAQGDRIQASNKMFRRELAAWVHPNHTRRRDGMPAYAFGRGNLASYVTPLVLRAFDWGKAQAARDRQLTIDSPALAVLFTERDSQCSWIEAGEALAHVLLQARADDLWASFMNQPVVVPELRPKVGELLGVTGFPQMILRLGYAPGTPPTPRRAVDEMLIS